MSSTINTNGIDVNYPIPGKNNTTQGFRNNFDAIKTNLNVAANEITDLENKVVLKSALANSTLNNDMANTLISNAATLSFRQTTYNLGNALTGTIVVDCSLGDLQYGNVDGDVIFQFGSWPPVGTQASIYLNLGISNTEATISWPANVIFNDNNFGTTILENFENISNVAVVSAPYDVTQLNYKLTTVDCGNSIYIEPVNRPYQATQIQQRTPPSTGQVGDKVGTICIDAGGTFQLTANSLANDYFVTSNTSTLALGMPITFTAGNAAVSTEANITLGNTYYISNIANSTAFKVSDSSSLSSNVNLAGNADYMKVNPVQYMYVAVENFNANIDNKNINNTASPNTVTLSSGMGNMLLNNPIIFTGDDPSNVGIEINKVYYIKTISGSDITISETRYNGVAGPEFQGINTVATANIDVDFDVYNGVDIFRRINLNTF